MYVDGYDTSATELTDEELRDIARAIIPIIQDENRAQIVAWLRSKEAARIACSHYAYMNDLADAIEAGEHGKESGVPLK